MVVVGGAGTLSDGRFRGNAPSRARFTTKTTHKITAPFNKENSFAKLDCNSEGLAPIGFVEGHPNPIGRSFRGNATNRTRFTAKTTIEITAQFNTENSFSKLDCNSEGFAPIGFGGGGRTLSGGRFLGNSPNRARISEKKTLEITAQFNNGIRWVN